MTHAAPPPAGPDLFTPGAGPAATVHRGVAADLTAAPDLGQAEALSTKRRFQIQLTGWGCLSLAFVLTLLWMIWNVSGVIALAIALVAAVAIDGFVAMRGIRFTTIELTPVGNAVALEPTRWHLHVPDLRRPVRVHPVRLPIVPDVLIDRRNAGILTLPATPRGVVHFVVFDVVSVGPTGLTRASRRVRATPPTPLVIGPRELPLHVRWPFPRAVAYGLSESAPRGDDLFRGVRPYQRGDERRKIHWKATAHTNELMVREDDGTGIIALQIAVDLGPPGPINEHVVANAAWLANAAVKRGWLVQLVTVDDTGGVPHMPALGRPLTLPPYTVASSFGPPQVLAQTVQSNASIIRQLATAAPGSPPTPRWVGFTCRVTPAGVVFA